MLEDMLDQLGCTVTCAATTIPRALAHVAATPAIDVAILDVHIGGDMIYPVADALLERQIPFLFSTGYSPADMVLRYPASLCLSKPYTSEELDAALVKLGAGRASSNRQPQLSVG